MDGRTSFHSIYLVLGLYLVWVLHLIWVLYLICVRCTSFSVSTYLGLPTFTLVGASLGHFNFCTLLHSMHHFTHLHFNHHSSPIPSASPYTSPSTSLDFTTSLLYFTKLHYTSLHFTKFHYLHSNPYFLPTHLTSNKTRDAQVCRRIHSEDTTSQIYLTSPHPSSRSMKMYMYMK